MLSRFDLLHNFLIYRTELEEEQRHRGGLGVIEDGADTLIAL